MRKRKIFFLSPHSDPLAPLGEVDAGGQCLYELKLATEIARQGRYEVDIFCARKYGRAQITQVVPGFRVIRVDCSTDEFIRKEEMEAYLSEFTKQVCEYIKTDGLPQVLHGHYWDGGKAMMMLSQMPSLRGVPTVWTPHSLGTIKRRNFTGINAEARYNFIPRILWENYVTTTASSITASTDHEKQILAEEYLALENKIKVIKPGSDYSQADCWDTVKARKEFRLPINGKILVTAGRMTQSKGYHHAIEVLHKLVKRRGSAMTSDYHLAIVGGTRNTINPEEKEYFGSLKKLVSKYKLSKHVTFIEAVDNTHMPAVYSCADIYIALAEAEPFGLSIIEAMSMGCLVLAADRFGPRSIISHMSDGILLNPTDYDGIALKIEYIFKQKKLLEQIKANAAHTAKSLYSWSKSAQEFITIYDLLIKGKAGNKRRLRPQPYFLTKNLEV